MTDLSGTLEGVGLPAVVRFLSGLHKTGCLRITHHDWNGEIFFANGRVVSATLGSRHGLSALDALVQALPGGTFTFSSDTVAPENGNIDLSQEALQAHLDELVERTASGAQTLPSLDAVPHVVPMASETPAEDAVPLDRGTLQTLLAVDGVRSVREIVSQRASFEALWQLANLTELGLVRMERTSTETPPIMISTPAAKAVEVEPRPTPEIAPTMRAAAFEPRVVEPTLVEPTMPEPTIVEPSMPEPAPVAASASPSVLEAITLPSSAAPFAATPETASMAVHCPKLGFEDDPSSSFARPTRLHRCFAAATPLPLSLDQQRELCLSEQYGTCPRLASAGEVEPMTAASAVAPTPDIRRRGAAAVAAQSAASTTAASAPASEPRPATTDPRIVRLPFGGRQRGATADRQVVGAPEPSRLRQPMVSPHEGGSTRPTPLRTRMQRPVGPAAEIGEADVSPRVISDIDEPMSTLTGVAEPADRRTPRRLLPLSAPMLAAAGVGVAVVALSLALIVPNLGPLTEPEITNDVLPNSSAVVAGTPISQIPTPRPTLAAQAAEPTAAAPAQPTQTAPRPTTAPATAPAAAAAATGPRMLIDESFDDNALGWPNSAQGVAAVTGGALRITPRQASQFVALGAPIPDIVRDVVVSATFRKIGGPAGGGYGIIVRDQGPGPRDGQNQVGRYYVLEAGDKGEIGIWRRDGERWIDLLPWQRSDAVRSGNAVNELTVRAIGDRLSLSVNGTEVASHTDATLPVGGVGAFVGGDGNQVALEQFSVQVP